ncbi:MAG: hypothetical protein HYS12_25650 [Planctomycetes bacterium]|nr:hypothetical protein [Planctomycetota bacterium]
MPDIRYLNVDLDLESRVSLAPIVEAFGEDVVVLHQSACREFFTASFEAAGSGCSGDAEGAINDLCLLVENLPDDARRLWDECCTRVFDIGYESGDSPRSFRSILHPETVMRVAAVGAAIMVTIYPRAMEDAGPDAAPDRGGIN